MGFFDRFKTRTSGEPDASAPRRAVVIGLDGTPCSLLRRLAGDGTMPNVRDLLGSGSLRTMTTTIPEISSVAWSSFMTGTNPGKHGVYGFLDLKPSSYRIYFPNATHVKGETLWDVLGRHGKRAVVVNVPSTYPAREINGVLISGFVAIQLERATWPPSLVPRLKEVGYQIDVDARKKKESDVALMADVFHTLERREIILMELFEKESWDLFIGVITETDRLQHFFWEAIEDANHPFHERFRSFYGRVDDVIGRIADAAGPDDRLTSHPVATCSTVTQRASRSMSQSTRQPGSGYRQNEPKSSLISSSPVSCGLVWREMRSVIAASTSRASCLPSRRRSSTAFS